MMSFMYKRKSSGPKTEPCGTPKNILFCVEYSPEIEVYCLRLVRYDDMRLCDIPLTP